MRREQVISVEGDMVRTTGGMRQMVADMDVSVGKWVNVKDGEIIGWRRKQGGVVTVRRRGIKTIERLYDDDTYAVVSRAIGADMDEMSRQVLTGPAGTGWFLETAAYNASKVVSLWTQSGIGSVRVVICSTDAADIDVGTFSNWYGYMYDSYLNDFGDFVWVVFHMYGTVILFDYYKWGDKTATIDKSVNIANLLSTIRTETRDEAYAVESLVTLAGVGAAWSEQSGGQDTLINIEVDDVVCPGAGPQPAITDALRGTVTVTSQFIDAELWSGGLTLRITALDHILGNRHIQSRLPGPTTYYESMQIGHYSRSDLWLVAANTITQLSSSKTGYCTDYPGEIGPAYQIGKTTWLNGYRIDYQRFQFQAPAGTTFQRPNNIAACEYDMSAGIALSTEWNVSTGYVNYSVVASSGTYPINSELNAICAGADGDKVWAIADQSYQPDIIYGHRGTLLNSNLAAADIWFDGDTKIMNSRSPAF